MDRLPIAILVVYNVSCLVIRVEVTHVAAKKPPEAGEILQGTLNMLILRTLVTGPAHGHTIAQVISTHRRTRSRWSKARSIPHCTASKTAAGYPRNGA